MATVPTFRTWVSGEIVTAAYLNSNVRDAGNYWLARPLAILRQTVGQSIPTATWTAILLDTEDIDRDGGHSTVTNTARYTSPTAGYLMFSGAVAHGVNATAARGAAWALNGVNITPVDALVPTVAATFGAHVAAPTELIAVNGSTDYVTLQAYQNSGGALTTVAASHMCVLWVSNL